MGKMPLKICHLFWVLPLLLLLSGGSLFAQETETDMAGLLKGKTVWVVDVNTNEYFQSFFQMALAEVLPQNVPGMIVNHVITAEKGNPFFLLKQEDYPDAVIVSLAVCDATSKNVANYASAAAKKGISSAMVYFAEVRDLMEKWNESYRNPAETAVEITEMPQSKEEAMPIAEQVAPMLIEKLEEQLSK